MIRENIEHELKPFFYQRLNSLEYEVKAKENTSIRPIAQEILNSINICRAKISTVMKEFENFFYRDDVQYKDFTLQGFTNTCVGIERQIHAGFDQIKLNTNIIGDKKLRGNTFSDFVEIIIMLMNNAITHAGFSEMNSLELSLNFSIGCDTNEAKEIRKTLVETDKSWENDNLMLLSVQNNLSPDKNIEEIREKVANIFDKAKDPQILKKYSISEGGSGIYKIYKTINYNVSVPYVILYTIEENTFILFLAVNASELIV